MNSSKKPESLNEPDDDLFDFDPDKIEPSRWDDQPLTEVEIAAMVEGLGDEPPVSRRITDLINSLPENIKARLQTDPRSQTKSPTR